MSANTAVNTGFHTRPDGFLYCDDVRVADVHHQLMTSERFVRASPAYLYSRRQIEKNVQDFFEAFKTLPVPAKLNFSMKCNYNLHILRLLRSMGCGVTLVSGMEMQMAGEAGFEPRHMLLNGSGKTRWEVTAAVQQGALLNVDSEFDLQQMIEVCRQQGEGTVARVLLRLNLDIDPRVHKYLSTGTAASKFGLDPDALSRVTSVLTSDLCPVRVEGLHCHLGSTVKDTNVFRESVSRLLALRQELKAKGLPNVNLLNVGGGLAIDYQRHRDKTLPFREEEDGVKTDLYRLRDYLRHQHSKVCTSDADHCGAAALYQDALDMLVSYIQERIPRFKLDQQLQALFQSLDITESIAEDFPKLWRPKEKIPTPADLTSSLCDVFVTPRDNDVTLLFEPGRAILGNAGVLMMETLGFKSTRNNKFLVVDGAMTDVIRPSLYGAYHFIHPAIPSSSPSSSTSSSSTTPSSTTTTTITTTNNSANITTKATTITTNTNNSDGRICNKKIARCSQSHRQDDDDDEDKDEDEDVEGVVVGRRKESGRAGEEEGEYHVMDVVGPVCESGDFLGKNRLLPVPARGACVVLHDAGAYCSSLASNYNLRMRAAEVLVEGLQWHLIRRPETLQDLMAPFSTDHLSLQ